jgi:hypothetical protein
MAGVFAKLHDMKKNAKDLKRGDVILALDGHEIPNAEIRRITVTKYIKPTGTGTHHVHVEDPNCKASSPDRYIQGEVTYGRLVTLSGHRMLKTDEDRYVSLDGRFAVEADHTHITDCEDRHTVRITSKDRALYYKMLADKGGHHRAVAMVTGHDWADACRDYGQRWFDYEVNKYKVIRGYMCPGGVEHNYTQWIAFQNEGDKSWQAEWCDNATDAAAYLPEGA